jgi:hypothetical protein
VTDRQTAPPWRIYRAIVPFAKRQAGKEDAYPTTMGTSEPGPVPPQLLLLDWDRMRVAAAMLVATEALHLGRHHMIIFTSDGAAGKCFLLLRELFRAIRFGNLRVLASCSVTRLARNTCIHRLFGLLVVTRRVAFAAGLTLLVANTQYLLGSSAVKNKKRRVSKREWLSFSICNSA